MPARPVRLFRRMYESHFGLTAAPFSLSPDPAFFFGSRGHKSALSYLQFGVYQGEGFVVVTGEVGAGKTTLVRTLLSDLNPDEIVAAQIVSTQLEAGDLLRSVALAFGMAPKSLSKAELIATIEAFLTLLVTKNKRALLIVDEAQNLSREAVEELRMLSNFQLGSRALLQSFLVGQPELRALLTSKPMEQFRQRVIASCHLGPMDSTETRDYIEHRLHQVGWSRRPTFREAAYSRIFHWTSGIPRRVNLLCNRLMLSAYLSSLESLDADAVDVVGDEMRGEVGDASMPVSATPAPAVDPQETDTSEQTLPSYPAATPRASTPPASVPLPDEAAKPSHPRGPLVLVAVGDIEDAKASALLRALVRYRDLPRIVRVALGPASRPPADHAFDALLGLDVPRTPLDPGSLPAVEQMAEVLYLFSGVVEQHRPGVIVVFGSSDPALACSLVAGKRGCRLVHVDAGSRAGSRAEWRNAVLIDRMSDVLYPSEMTCYLNLIREGVNEADVCHAGSLLLEATHAAAGSLLAPKLVRLGDGTAVPRPNEGANGLILLDESVSSGDAASLTEQLSSLHEISREKPLLWPLSATLAARMEALGMRQLADHARITLVQPVGFMGCVDLIRDAAFVVTDSRDVQQQAALLEVRDFWVGPNQSAPVPSPSTDHRATAASIAEHLVQWLAAHA